MARDVDIFKPAVEASSGIQSRSLCLLSLSFPVCTVYDHMRLIGVIEDWTAGVYTERQQREACGEEVAMAARDRTGTRT